MKPLTTFMSTLLLVFFLASCGEKKLPVDLSTHTKKSTNLEVPYKEMRGVKTIPAKLNGVEMDMILDSGCSGIHLSLTELQYMAKQGKVSDADVQGTTLSQVADGTVVENLLVNLDSVRIGGDNGILLKDVKASVALNQVAPLLLGNGVLDEVASYEVDNVHKKVIFKRK